MLEGKVCLVTGGGSGIGRATVLEMIAQHAEAVVVTDLNGESCAETAELGRSRGGEVEALVADVTNVKSVADAMSAIKTRFGRLDVLHNNAGIVDGQLTEQTTIEECPESVWDRIFEVNVKGTWLCTKAAIRLLRQSEAGAIVNCGSVSGAIAVADEPAYSASKAAVVQLTRNTASELAPDGIRCNCYCPASINTPMTDASQLEAEQLSAITSRYLVQRLGEPLDVARLVCFLASDQSAFITGTSVMIDGGLTAWRGARRFE